MVEKKKNTSGRGMRDLQVRVKSKKVENCHPHCGLKGN